MGSLWLADPTVSVYSLPADTSFQLVENRHHGWLFQALSQQGFAAAVRICAALSSFGMEFYQRCGWVSLNKRALLGVVLSSFLLCSFLFLLLVVVVVVFFRRGGRSHRRLGVIFP